ncbi:hypothetical protein A9Q81_11615 [Gammaproteobacteria bacterium 42_54_T18]|nr:hypothetical protein A9Q81_11615 [Gammaproteobacteria bacterium 42_54_T18]
MATVDDWNKISQAPSFQGLDQGMKVQVRDRFFEKHIAPNAPQELLSEIKVKFDERTGLQPRTSNLGVQPVPDSNMLRGAVERSSGLVGNLLSTGDTISRSLEETIPLGGFAFKEGDMLPSYMNGAEFKEYSESQNIKQPLEVAGDYLKKAKVGYVPNHTWEKVKEEFSNDAFSGDAWKEVVLYATEQGVKSIPDMAASVLSLPLYVTARSGEIGEARAKNKGKDKAEMEDILEAAPAALGSALLERFGAKGITKAGSEVLGKEAIKAGFAKAAKRVAVAGGVAGGKEAATEFFQEGVVEYIGERLGTDAKMSVIEALDRGAAGAVAGGIYGGGAGTAVAATKEVIQLNKPGGYDLDEVTQESKPEPQPSEAPQAIDQQSSNLTGSNLQWTDTSNIAAQSQENLQKDYNGPGSFDPNQAGSQNGQAPAEQQWTDTSGIAPASMEDLQSNYQTPERPNIQSPSNLIPMEGELMSGALPGTPQIGYAERPDFVVNPEGEAAGQTENNVVEDIPALPFQSDSTVYADSRGGFVDRSDIDRARVEQGNEQREAFVAKQEEKQNNPGGRGFYDQIERGATQEELSEYESLFLVADEIGSKESLEIAEALEYGEITPEQAQIELDSLQQPELEQAQEDSGAVDIDALANEAATSPTNELSEPTDGQKEAGNYKKGRVVVHGMAIAIENPKGSKRSGTDPDGTAWENEIHSHYGDLTGTKGADGDALDVFVGESPESQKVWVIDQLNKDGSFDEHKIMLGFTHKAKAISGYKKNYNRGWKVGPVTAMSVNEFKAWVKDADTTKPLTDFTSKKELIKKKEKPKKKLKRDAFDPAKFSSVRAIRAEYRVNKEHTDARNKKLSMSKSDFAIETEKTGETPEVYKGILKRNNALVAPYIKEIQGYLASPEARKREDTEKARASKISFNNVPTESEVMDADFTVVDDQDKSLDSSRVESAEPKVIEETTANTEITKPKRKAGENKKDPVRFSSKSKSKPRHAYTDAVDDIIAEDRDKRLPIVVSKVTPGYLVELGVEQLPLVTNGSIIDKLFYDHSMKQDLIKRLPELISESPVFVFDSDTQENSLVIVPEETVNGNPLLIILKKNKKIGRIDVNFVPSFYPKNNAKQLDRWAKDGLLRYSDKKKVQPWSTRNKLQLPYLVRSKVGLTDNVTPSKSPVKPKHAVESLAERRVLKARVNKEYKKHQEQVETWLAPTTLKWGNNAPKVVVYPTHHDIPSEVIGLAEEQFDPSGTKGWYVHGTVFLVASNLKDRVDTLKTLAHESIGHWGMTLQEEQDYQDIVSKIHALKRTDSYVKGVAGSVERDYNNIDETTTAEEIIARIAEDMVTGNPTSDAVSNVWKRLVGAVRKFLRKIFPLQFSRRDIEAMLANSERALRSSLKSTRKENTNKPLFSAAESIENVSPEIARKRLQDVLDESGAGAYDKVKGLLAGNSMVEAVKTGALKAVTLRQLGDLASKILPQINVYVDTVNKMLTRRNQMAEKAATIVEGWQKWAGKNRKVADKLHDLMHEATLAQVDPSENYVDMTDRLKERIGVVQDLIRSMSGDTSKRKKDLENEHIELRNDLAFEPQRKKHWDKLRPSWDALSPEAKETFIKVRNEYKYRHMNFKHILLKRVASAEINTQLKKEMLAKLRYDFETQELMGPYFPLARFGRYWVSTTDEKGEKVYLTFESEVEQKRVKGNLEKEGYKTKHGQMLDSTMQQDSASLGFVNDVVKIIEGGNVTDEASFEMSDAVYQLYLQSMPSRSMRHNFQHRKGVQGYSKNAIRAFADNMMKGAYQLARLEYQDDLSGQMEEMREEASKAGDNKKGAFYNEMLKRHEWVMNPTNSVIAQKLTALGFVWMLGVSPAAAMVNLTQTFVVALPVIGARYGALKTAKEMVKASKGFNIMDGAINPKHLTQGEKDAMQVWKDSGLIDGTRAHDLTGIAEHGGYNYSGAQEWAMRKVSWLFHRAEQFNREVTALSAYRLGIKKHGEGYHQKAIEEAEKLTWESHFDYGNTNRAPFMQSNAAKVALQFKQYSQNISYYLMRNLSASLNRGNWTLEERKIARRQLLGSLGATALIGGANALPLWWLFGLANLKWDDEDEPFDAREEFFVYLAEATGSKDAADKIMNGLGGAGVSGRVSLDGLWVRDSNRDLEGENLWSFYAKQIAGPTLGGILPQWFEGARKVSNGQYRRSIENFTPVFAKNISKSLRYYDEGALNLRGDELKSREDFSYAQLFTQGIGFSDSGVIKQYTENSAIKGAAEKIKKRRRWLITQYYMAWKDGDTAERKGVLKKIRRYNKHNPRFPISAGTLSRSMKTRARYSRESLNGINVNKRLRYLADEKDFVN